MQLARSPLSPLTPWKAGFCFCTQWMNSCNHTCWQIEACCIANTHTMLPSPWCLHRSLLHQSVCQGLSRSSSPHSAICNIPLPHASQSSWDTEGASVFARISFTASPLETAENANSLFKMEDIYFKHTLKWCKPYDPFSFPLLLHIP